VSSDGAGDHRGASRQDSTVEHPSVDLSLQRALDLQKRGRSAEAAALCRAVLADQPQHPEALLLLGLILATQPDPAEAAPLLEAYLDRRPDDPAGAYHLGMLRQRLGDPVGALELFDRALARSPEFGPALHGRGVALHELGRLDAADEALLRALALAPTDAVLRNNLGSLRHSQERLTEALAEFDRALALDPALAMARRNRASVRAALDQAPAAAQPGLRARDSRASGAPTIAVEPCAGGAPQARILVICSSDKADLSTRCLLDPQRFERIYLVLPRPNGTAPDAPPPIDRLPPFDVVFNAIADPDLGAAYLDQAAALCRALDRPVLNPPARIPRTSRDEIAARLSAIPGLVAPATRRVARDALVALAGGPPFARPLLVRPAGSHGGEGLARIDRPADLAAYLRVLPGASFFLTDYVEFRSPDGYFRKYRLIFVDRRVYPYHLAIGRDWKLHYWRVDMDAAPWMTQEEAGFLADHAAAFPGALADTAERIARTLDLDYAGLDCGIAQDGRVVLFEANANMLVHLTEPRETAPHKHASVARIVEAMTDLVMRRKIGAPATSSD
jgi:tetratricopeptide (TPR) repeat protein